MATLVSSILHKESFHPISKTSIDIENPSIVAECSLYLYFTLPPLVFADPYELAHHEQFYTFRTHGLSNLEFPVNAVPQNSSYLLLNIAQGKLSRHIELKLPLHLRYGDPSKISSNGYHSAELAWPTGFLECPRSSATTITSYISEPPILPGNLSSSFSVSSTFIPITPLGTNVTEEVLVPTGRVDDLAHVEIWTILTILLSLFFIVRASWVTFHRTNRPTSFKTD